MATSETAVIGAGVAGLTCGVLLAESGARVRIFAEETGDAITSAAAGAIWYPYDAEPLERVIAWALATYDTLLGLTSHPPTGVSMIELHCYTAAQDEISLPSWGERGQARRLPSVPEMFRSGFAIDVPLIDTSIYLEYLRARFRAAGGTIELQHLAQLHDVPPAFKLLVNCAGVGARELVHDREVEPHRGQIALVPRAAAPDHAIVCDDEPFMYVFPRSRDCVFGGTNTISDDRRPSAAERSYILEACARVLGRSAPAVLGERVGLRPFRRSGVRLERGALGDGRAVIHNYGHGGSGFTLSWGCAEEVVTLALA